MQTGMFIAFEGIDGSGKTTLSNRVAAALRERGPERRTRARGGLVRVAGDAGDPRSLPGRPQPGAGAPRGAAALRRAGDSAGGGGRDPRPLARRRRHHRSIPVHGGGAGAADSPPARRDDSRDHRRRGRRRVARHGGPRRRRPVGRARPPQGRQADVARAAARRRARGWREAASGSACGKAISRSRPATPTAGSSSTTPMPIWTSW